MFSEQQLNIINGLLLGDGHLSLKGKAKNASLIVKRSLKDLDYSKYHLKIFKDYVTDSGLRTRSSFDKRTNKIYHHCEFSLKASAELTAIYSKWYVAKKKIVPKDLALNAETIATWFCDDGWVIKSKNNYFQISFATNGFSVEETEFLKNLLTSKYQENIGTCKTGKQNQKTIHLADYAARKLILDIDSVFPSGMERKRKWAGIEFPAPNQSIKLSAQKRREQVAEFLSNNQEFYLVDLARFLDWKFQRKDGAVEWDSQNAKRYLQKYLDDGTLKSIKKDSNGSFYKKC